VAPDGFRQLIRVEKSPCGANGFVLLSLQPEHGMLGQGREWKPRRAGGGLRRMWKLAFLGDSAMIASIS
jgi:hypothetical protein